MNNIHFEFFFFDEIEQNEKEKKNASVNISFNVKPSIQCVAVRTKQYISIREKIYIVG
jgi:hypothetical protein